MSQFPSTQWLMVEMAGQSSPMIARAAMNHLLERYWQPMFVHLRYKGVQPEAAEDLLQDFILEILDKNLLAIADREKGKFRTLLLTALDRFAISKHRYNTAAKRAPKDVRSLDAGEGTDVAGGEGPSLAFERAWALDVLAETLATMHEECESSGDMTRWTVFDRRVLAPLFEDVEPPDYVALAKELGLGGEKAAMNVLVTAKRQFARTLRDLVREYIVQSGPQATTAAVAESRSTGDAKASATRQLAEHTVVQAVEREIAELQQVLANSRSAGPLAPSEEAIRDDDNPRKAYFWKRLTQGAAAAPTQVESMLDWGSVVAEGGFDSWVADLLDTDVRKLLGYDYAATGPIRAYLSDESPRVEVLEHLKEWANVQRFTLSASPQGKLADALYFLCIAAAMVHLGLRITGMKDAGLRSGFESLMKANYLEPDLGQLVNTALGMIGS
jgi:DNA-directed RNA polymerase specialized sigma24 family protein